ncbi:cellulase N-terminal Ig-like domain-containing protein [Amaricoccus macauensis]|uniref:cellulase N-terminal Ig-like domain-containing protein n=1 Tax=Amaricoccus macauensis TaxID=57001 RepID=UPI003C7E3BAF
MSFDSTNASFTVTPDPATGAYSVDVSVSSDQDEPSGVRPSVIDYPALSGTAQVGTELRVEPGTWSGTPAPLLSFQWQRDGFDIPGATGETYNVAPEDDQSELCCRVSALNLIGQSDATTPFIRVAYPAPTLLADLGEEVIDFGSGVEEFETAQNFEGQDLRFTAKGGSATIDPETGLLAIPTDIPLSNTGIIVTAANSGGSASSTLYVTTERENNAVSEALAANHEAAFSDRLAFAGARFVQAVLYDNKITPSAYTPVEAVMDRSWKPDAHNRLGGEGSYADTAGNFSSDVHENAPQLFFPWASAEATEYTDAFRPTDGGAANLSAADLPENWTARINGAPVRITRVFRKSVPIQTAQVAPRTYDNRRRHLVTLELEEDIPTNALVVVTPPSGGTLAASYDGQAVSEAIHVCQEGYASSGPKKAYVGLWLGTNKSGNAASTNSTLSAYTGWKLIRVEDDEVAASGTLSLVKPATETHQSNLNYNGCDIFEADFSDVSDTGHYRLEVAKIGSSMAFAIEEQPYTEAFRAAARWYFHQRSGCAIEEPFGEGRERPRNDHPADGVIIHQTDVLLGRHSEGFVGGSDVFEVLKETGHSSSHDVAEPTGDTSPGELVPNDAFANSGNWRVLDASFILTGSALQINATSGYRNATLDLTNKTTSNQTYTLGIHLVELTGRIRAKLNRGTTQAITELTTGWNLFEIENAENQGIFIDALAGASGLIDAISLSPKDATDDTQAVEAATATRSEVAEQAWGGWHDAGDWDRRIQHMGVVFTMAQMVELLPSLREIDLNIPESGCVFADSPVEARKSATDTGDGKTILPDLIHEALWGISLWRRTQRADGGIIGGVEYSLDGIAGSVSWNHLQETYAYAPEEWSAYQFVTAAAKLGHVISVVCGDEKLGQSLKDEASLAWEWAEKTLDTGIDSYNTFDNTAMAIVRVAAAASLYRATGNEAARAVFESYNAFKPIAKHGLPRAGEDLGTRRGDYVMEAWEYVRAGQEGRAVDATVSEAIVTWSDRRFATDTRIGSNYGLHSTGLYPWGAGWMRFGPGSNWRCGRLALDLLAKGEITEEVADTAIEGMWFALGCNPSNVSLVQGLGIRPFGDPLMMDAIDGPIPGNPCFGPAAGNLRTFEINSMGDSIYPKAQSDWPRYAAIFESSRAVVSSEHGMKSNALEWLFATGFVNEALSRN